MKNDDLDPNTGQSLLKRRLEWIFGFPYLNTGIQIDNKHQIGLDSLDHNIKGEVLSLKSMLTYDAENDSSLLHLLWRYQGRIEQQVMGCLECLADIITSSPAIMEYFSNLPGYTYQYARYTDWIQPFLMSQLNKSDSGSGYGYNSGGNYYSATSKEDIVKVMSKFEIYQGYLHQKDNKDKASDEDTKMAEPETTGISAVT